MKLASNVIRFPTPRKRSVRPITTQYFGRRSLATGHSSTSLGAIRAATLRLISGEFRTAEIYTRQGNWVASLHRTGRIITTTISRRLP